MTILSDSSLFISSHYVSWDSYLLPTLQKSLFGLIHHCTTMLCFSVGLNSFFVQIIRHCLRAVSYNDVSLFLTNSSPISSIIFSRDHPSVTPFSLCPHHRIIMKFSGGITNDQGKVHAKGQGQRSKVKVTEGTTQLNHFRPVTSVWIHLWWWNNAYSLMLLRRGALLFFKVICQISRPHGSKNRRIWPKLGASGL